MQLRRIFLAGALLAPMLCVAGTPAPSLGATGGSAGPSAPSTKSGGSAPSPSAPAKRAPVKTSAHVTTVRITRVSCTPSSRCSKNPRQVSLRGTLEVEGIHLAPNMVVAFPSSPGARISRFSPASRLRRSGRSLLVTVPSHAHSGRIKILLSKHRYTSSFGPIYVYAHSIGPPAAKLVDPAPSDPSVFDGQGMWIWYMSHSSGGSVAAIAAQAHAAGVTTLFIKSSDGSTNYWSQFSSQLVAELHANGLKACAWQYVYGSNPAGEAALGAEAVTNGADCLVIDAEAEYEGHYAAAQTYIADLRATIGEGYPLALASFPYVNYHPKFPYSVFLGPGGAQFNLPQMYWKDIGQSVDTLYANTYIANRVYGRPIFPLGQTYGGVSSSDLLRFREEAVDYGASGLSFWDWQETPASGWSTLAAPLAPLTSVVPNTSFPELKSGSKGDPVLWMQEHLATAVPAQETTGIFASQTLADVQSFQSSHGIAPSGVVEAATWQALLALAPVAVSWTGTAPQG
ncbi:MAG TPA: peptidoglycan-binding domain-containing protein [Solirubrobacteraceae bacterium]|nr:peptidoglycan-binding domain-containing protein [Solirubrobacteraceae bacterium]